MAKTTSVPPVLSLLQQLEAARIQWQEIALKVIAAAKTDDEWSSRLTVSKYRAIDAMTSIEYVSKNYGKVE